MAEDPLSNSCELVDAKKVALHLGLKRSFIYSLVKSKQIPYIPIGDRLIRFDLREIDQWIETLKQLPYPPLKNPILIYEKNNPVDVDSFIKKMVDNAKAMVYINHHGKPNRKRGLRKESGEYGTL